MKYNIGLDIGTNSVGWAVTDQHNNLLKHQKQNMWGARLFNAAETAVTRRGFRSTRRRMARRQQRLALLRELVEPMITPIDQSFYARLAATQLYGEDNQYKFEDNYNLFIDKTYNDKHYFHAYPTMYHLRAELIKGKGLTEAVDPRLIYLAVSHLLKYRGNFLYEGQDLAGISNAFDEQFICLSELLQESSWLENEVANEQSQAIMAIFQDSRLYRSEQVKQATELVSTKETKKQWQEIFKGITGMKMNAKNLFNDSFSNESGNAISFSFGDSTYEETKEQLLTLLQDDSEIIEVLEQLYSWYVLQNVLQGESGLTDAMLKKYEQHKQDLQLLKQAVRKYVPEAYKSFFRLDQDKVNNYVAYIKNTHVANEKVTAKKTCTQADLWAEIKKLFKNVADEPEVKAIFEKIEKNSFLPKQNTTDNGAIPYQLQLIELQQILENQSKFHPHLATVKDKIISILTFRIPYYVGPLTQNGRFAWAEFKEQGRIYPWNFEEKVNRDASAEKFIYRMISTCTYLLGEPVFPRQSLIYNEYTVLNELNKIRINGKVLLPEQKQAIFTACFKNTTKKTVTKKDIILYCQQHWTPYDANYEVTGFQDENKFASSLTSYIDFVKIFDQAFVDNNLAMIEQIITWLTVFEDKAIIKRKIKNTYPQLDGESVNKIARLRYSGWSELSQKLLVGLTTEIEGRNKSIMDLLWSTNDNFMQIIHEDRYDFKEILANQLTSGESKTITYEEVKKLAGSPALKRGIWQTIQIVQEIEKVMKCPPTNIFIEFAREDQASKRTSSRYKQLETLYKKMESDELTDLSKEVKAYEKSEISKRLFLYFTQNGKCAYTAEPLEISSLHLYQIDHILPQSLIKDDSIDNTVLVKADANQNKAGNKTATQQANSQAKHLWHSLRAAGLMTKRKYDNLTNPVLSDYRIKGFINRQLVETRQISKHVAQLLQRSTNANVYAMKATLASQFRKQFGLAKTRLVNDYHHAHDAYLSAVIGNFVQQKYPQLDAEFLYQGYLAYQGQSIEKMRKYKYGFIISSMKDQQCDGETGELIWNGEEDVVKIRKAFGYRDCFITKKLEENTGQLWNLNPVKKKAGIHARKNGMDSARYGGYEGITSAYSVIFTCERHKGKKVEIKKELLGIPTEYAALAKQQPEKVQEYIYQQIMEKHEQKGWKVENIQIIKAKILKNQLFELEGGLYTLASPTEWNNAKQLILPQEYITLVAKLAEKQPETEQAQLSQQMEQFYQYFIEKLRVYPLYGGAAEKLAGNKAVFAKLTYEEQKQTIEQLLNMTKANAVTARLKATMNLSDETGRVKNKALDVSKHTFIDQSITGMYSKKWRV